MSFRVSREEMSRILAGVAKRKASRTEKRAGLPWGKKDLEPAPRRPRRKRSDRSRLVGKLDAVFSLWIRLRGKKRTGGLCEVCVKRPIGHCFHWVSRGHFPVRWDPENAVASCRGCNLDEHHRKQPYRDLHVSRIGLKAREALEDKARGLAKFTDADLQAMVADFTARLAAG